MGDNSGNSIDLDENSFLSEKCDTNDHSDDHLSSLLLLNALPQQVWTADETGAINYVNKMICHDFGFNQETIIAHGWQSFVHPEDLPESISRWQEALHSGKDYTTEFRLRFADGHYYWHLARAVGIKRDGKPNIWVGTNTNIHDQKNNEQRKDEFISIASHELKTPLTTIKGYNQLMLRQVSEGKIKALLERSAGQVDRLEKLIKDLLDVSKINAGKLLFNYESFDFSEMLHQTIAGMQAIFPSHLIQLETDIQLAYNGDRYRLEQVLQNFLSNAIKYSPGADTVYVTASLADGNIIVSVKDDGIGIAAENLGKLFERYYRADNSSSRFDGLGLGLFISAEIIKRHSGSFWIDSEPGKGSTFSFKLPVDPQLQIEAEIRTESYYKDRYIRIYCPKESEIMHVEWTGYQDMRSVKHGGSLMIDYLRKNSRSKVFNDNRLVPGTWSEASDWAAEVWLPLMELAGLRFFAWILSPSAFSQLSARKSVDNKNKSAEISFFNSAEEGMDWLEKQAL